MWGRGWRRFLLCGGLGGGVGVLALSGLFVWRCVTGGYGGAIIFFVGESCSLFEGRFVGWVPWL